MRIYNINATQGKISFKRDINAISYQDAKNKFYNEINRTNHSFPYIQPDVVINSIFRRY